MMTKKKKVNPRKIPATMADVKKAKDEAVLEAVNTMSVMLYTVLADKMEFDRDKLRTVWNYVNELADSISEGRISIGDLRYILKTEYGIEFV